MGGMEEMKMKVDARNDRYPCCIVWSPLPPITWLLPFIGHTGICTEDGIIWDFAGPYSIGKGHMAFGSPTRYLMLDPMMAREKEWDQAISAGNTEYRQRMHNICFDNCHSHVARCLNEMAYKGQKGYNMFHIGIWMFFFGSFSSVSGKLLWRT